MLAPILRRTVLAERHRRLTSRIQLYEQVGDRAGIEAFQVRRFNDVWQYCLAQVPFYQAWRREYDLPGRIDRPAELRQFPPLHKRAIVEHQDEIFRDRRILGAYTTGGSTGQPTRYPRGAGELQDNWVGAYLGRQWSGIRPLEPTVHLWGHAHLFGTGWRGRAAHARRLASDAASGLTRLNAYDLSERQLALDYEALRRADPAVVSGYASAVVRLARYMARNGLVLPKQSRIRAVVLCAEGACDGDISAVQDIFRAPVTIEYGAAESGVIAMSKGRTRDIRVLWDSFICLTGPDGTLRISTLAERVFPLINYAIGDVVAPSDLKDGNALGFEAILGRAQDVVRVGTDEGVLELSAILPVHALKAYPGIIGVQFDQIGSDLLEIRMEADRDIDIADVTSYFARQIRHDHPGFDASSVRFVLVEERQTTVAGKHALFVR